MKIRSFLIKKRVVTNNGHLELPESLSPPSRHSIDDKRRSLERRDESEKTQGSGNATHIPTTTERKPGILLSRVHPRCNTLQMDRLEWSLDDFNNIKLMSERHTSLVFRATCKLTGNFVVLKSFDLRKLSLMSRAQQEREVLIHSVLSHPHIINMLVAFKQEEFITMVLEYANEGTLYDYLLMRQRIKQLMTEDEVKTYVVKPLLNALIYIHSLGIIHRDIKLENVLIKNGVIKLADFGVAINSRKERPVTRVGTLNYMSPEVLRCPYKKNLAENKDDPNIGGYDVHVDIWSLGVLVYECLNYASPYAADTTAKTKELISCGSLPVFLMERSELAVDFVYRCLALDPFDRPSAAELLHHPWLAQTTA